LVVNCGVVVSSMPLTTSPISQLAVGDPGGDLLEDPVADSLEGVGDWPGDGARHLAADHVAGVTDWVAAADEPAGDRADAFGDDPRRGAADVADRVGPGGRRRGLRDDDHSPASQRGGPPPGI
jgi:hypothetical protein